MMMMMVTALLQRNHNEPDSLSWVHATGLLKFRQVATVTIATAGRDREIERYRYAVWQGKLQVKFILCLTILQINKLSC
jgi:hypothetical protein